MLSVPHLIVIFIVALVVFGPEKIPELARNLGKVMAEFRRVTGDLRTTFEGHLRDLEREADNRRIAVPPAAPAAAPAATAAAESSSAPASPGTIPSDPPNAAAIAAAPADIPSPGATNASPDPPDPMHDPYLMHMDIPPQNFPSESEPSESEPKPERVIDGDGRNS
jgi:sec-independent protein translocase protein TatB